MQPSDLSRIADDPWISYLLGKNPTYPETALKAELSRVRRQVEAIRNDTSTPDQRASDYPQRFNPVSASALVNLTVGANDPGSSGNILHSRLRYFDPARRRAGLPADVAALVEKISTNQVVVTIINTNQIDPRRLVIRAGAYGEHHFESVTVAGKTTPINSRDFSIALAPGAGDTLTLTIKRYAHQPTLTLPW